MKVGLLIDDHMARPGGVQEYVRGLAAFLARQGHTPVIFSSGGGGAGDVPLIPLGNPLALRGSGSSTSIPLSLASPAYLRAVLERERCDILHVMAPYSPTLSGRLLTQSRARHVLTFLVAIEPGPYRAAVGALARLQRRSLSRIHARIAISPTAAATGRALYGGAYEIIPCGVDVAHFAAAQPRSTALPNAAHDIVYVGRLEARKGVAHLLRAFHRVERDRSDVRLVIGGDGPERQALHRLAAELGLRNVVFRGYVPVAELPHLIGSAAVFCAPATYAESFGIVLIEALAAGVPIVAAANAGYAGLLAAHPGNLLAAPGDDRALAGAIAVLLQSEAYRIRLGARNRAAAQQYSWDSVGAAIVAVYQRTLDASPR